MKKSIYILMILFIVFSTAIAEEKPKTTPLETFLAKAYLYYFTCQLEAQTRILQKKPLEESLECINTYKGQIKDSYKGAKQYIKNNDSATSMLKDYYAFWIASMDSIVPQGNESFSNYENRLSLKMNKLNELQQRLKLEIE